MRFAFVLAQKATIPHALRRIARRALRPVISNPPARALLRAVIRHSPPGVAGWLHRTVAKRVAFPSSSTFRHPLTGAGTVELLHAGSNNYLYWLGHYEPGTMQLIRGLAADARVIWDVGANVGTYAVLVSSCIPHIQLWAFEPAPAAAALLRQQLAINPSLAGRVHLVAAALGDVDAFQPLYVSGDVSGNSSLLRAFRPTAEATLVEVMRGDTLVERGVAPAPDLIKVDTEATEPAVLSGMPTILAARRPDLICEVLRGRCERQLESILLPLGYRLFQIWPSALREQDHIDISGRRPNLNYLFSARPLVELQARAGCTIIRAPA